MPPLLMMNSKALSIYQASQLFLAQSTNSCPDNDTKFLVTIWFNPSMVAIIENAQLLAAHKLKLQNNYMKHQSNI